MWSECQRIDGALAKSPKWEIIRKAPLREPVPTLHSDGGPYILEFRLEALNYPEYDNHQSAATLSCIIAS